MLKAHTINRAGKVALRSDDPREPPDIDFHYFGEGSDTEGADLEAVVDGVQIARDVMRGPATSSPKRSGLVRAWRPGSSSGTGYAIRPGATMRRAPAPSGRPAIRRPWSTAASGCTERRLRIVDASVFPRIPGFFIVASVYMLAEKASDVILADARG